MLETLRTLAEHEVKFVVGGGVALVLYGHDRMTMDLDVALDMERPNLQRFYKSVEDLRLEPSTREPLSSLEDPERIRELVETKHAMVFPLKDPDRPYRQIDVFLTPDTSYAELSKDAQHVQLPGFRVEVVNRRKLLEMKRNIPEPRDKDRWDIKFLENTLAEDAR
jgi:predicted nucleotidyltransferase